MSIEIIRQRHSILLVTRRRCGRVGGRPKVAEFEHEVGCCCGGCCRERRRKRCVGFWVREDVLDLSEQGDYEHESAPRLGENGELLSDLDAVVAEVDGA